jgi:hypothetical protein
MKKAKSLEVKLRSALRLIWSRSSERRAIIKAATIDDPENGKGFCCPICHKDWPIWAGEVDHDPPIGKLESWRDTVLFIDKLFYGPQRVICKTCHKGVTREQRRKK